MHTHHFDYMGIAIEYELNRKAVKYINLRVNQKGQVMVSAPKKAPLSVIDEFVRSKGDWIIFHLAEIEKMKHILPDNELYSGKTVFILGKPYTLFIQENPFIFITKKEDTIIIKTPFSDDQKHLREEYLLWLKECSKPVLETILKTVYEKMNSSGIPFPTMKIRNMRTRWGSCSTQTASIRLNLQLAKASLPCIEAVVFHELVHFLNGKHDASFYKTLYEYCPKYDALKKELENNFKDGI